MASQKLPLRHKSSKEGLGTTLHATLSCLVLPSGRTKSGRTRRGTPRKVRGYSSELRKKINNEIFGLILPIARGVCDKFANTCRCCGAFGRLLSRAFADVRIWTAVKNALLHLEFHALLKVTFLPPTIESRRRYQKVVTPDGQALCGDTQVLSKLSASFSSSCFHL